MVAYNFNSQFADLIESGEKTQTIRRDGKRYHAHPGVKIQLYTGLRSKACRKLGDAVCIDIVPVDITILPLPIKAGKPRAQITHLNIQGRPELIIGENPENWDFANQVVDGFARADGFRGRPGLSPAQEMAEFFLCAHGAGEFHGQLITWRPA